MPGAAGTLPALLSFSYRTLSRRPRFSRHKLFVEGDPFESDLRITNDGNEPFPRSDMLVTARWVFQSGDEEERQVRLAQGELAPGASKGDRESVELEAPGYTHLYVRYTPCDPAHGDVLHDARGREIDAMGTSALACFRGVSIVEHLSYWAIIFASVSAAIAAMAFVVSLLAFLHV